MGRNDDQIKMNGFRIELNEISNVICTNKNISDATTVALKRNNEVKKIISFVIPTTNFNEPNLRESLTQFLENKLPYYMLPGDIVCVEEFPYSSSHKIDKKKLIEEYIAKQFS